MGGDLNFESEPGAGTTFFFTARFGVDREPSRRRAAPPPGASRDAPRAGRRGHRQQPRAASRPCFARLGDRRATSSPPPRRRCAAGRAPPAGGRGAVRASSCSTGCCPGWTASTPPSASARMPGREHLPIILISAYAGKEEEARAEAVGVNVFLPKPITASSLLDAIIEASPGSRLERPRAAAATASDRGRVRRRARSCSPRTTRPTASSPRSSSRRLGIELEIAVNGREAVEMARGRAGTYAAILMDMQMPEMDGLEATRRIRAFLAGRRLPIIAMTANAMKSDLDACLAAGMNDYVTKPIDREVLFRTLRKWIAPRRWRRPRRPAARRWRRTRRRSWRRRCSPESTSRAVCGGSGCRGRPTAGSCCASPPARMQCSRTSAARSARRTAEAARRHAHSIVGSAGNVSADRLRELARALEQEAKAGGGEMARLLAAVEEEAARVLGAIEGLEAGSPPPPPARPRLRTRRRFSPGSAPSRMRLPTATSAPSPTDSTGCGRWPRLPDSAPTSRASCGWSTITSTTRPRSSSARWSSAPSGPRPDRRAARRGRHGCCAGHASCQRRARVSVSRVSASMCVPSPGARPPRRYTIGKERPGRPRPVLIAVVGRERVARLAGRVDDA